MLATNDRQRVCRCGSLTKFLCPLSALARALFDCTAPVNAFQKEPTTRALQRRARLNRSQNTANARGRSVIVDGLATRATATRRTMVHRWQSDVGGTADKLRRDGYIALSSTYAGN